MSKTVVHFLKWKSNGEVLAIFLEIPANPSGTYCVYYERVGEHGAGPPDLSPYTDPATPDEYEELHELLTRRGYDLRPVKRITWQMHLKRVQAARKS